MVMVLAGTVPQRAPHQTAVNADGPSMSDTVQFETSISNPSLMGIGQHPSANQLSVVGHSFSEPLLLLLMGSLLIAVGTSIRRLTASRHAARAVVPRQT
jgi:hypothetical protein